MKSPMNYRYQFEDYNGGKGRHTCPNCGKHKQFVLYIDKQTGDYLSDKVGRCNRESKCGYHYKPGEFFKDNPQAYKDNHQYKKKPIGTPYLAVEKQKPVKPGYIPDEIFRESLGKNDQNNLVKYLNQKIKPETVVGKLVDRFQIGTSNHWQGATIFWQIDLQKHIRTGKVMLYNPMTGKRIPKHIQWEHCFLKLKDFNLQQCLFGEHQLITEPKDKLVAIVESEKTAMIASVYLPNFIWLAVGGISNLTVDKCQALTGRKVVLFPDTSPANARVNAFQKWQAKARELQSNLGCKVIVSDLLETKATDKEKAEGLDFADYLIRWDYRFFSLGKYDMEDFEERAAIMEFDGNLSHDVAKDSALQRILKRQKINRN